jgi:hypothetical protein
MKKVGKESVEAGQKNIMFDELKIDPLTNLRLDIIIGMLNGSFPWEQGAYLRSLSDEDLQKVVDNASEQSKGS